jgi:SET domain-containing protein
LEDAEIIYANKLITSLSIKGVEVKRSTIHGLGLFATKDFRMKETICPYNGVLIPTTDDDFLEIMNSDYVFELYSGWCIDAQGINSGPGRYINDGIGFKRNNCTFCADVVGKRASVLATRNIKNGEEFLIPYSQNYWKQKNKQLKHLKQLVLADLE